MVNNGKAMHFGEFGHGPSPLSAIDFGKMLEDKLVRARDAMKRYNLGAVLCLTDPNIEYTTNVPVMVSSSAVSGNKYGLVPIEGTPIEFDECDSAYFLKHMFPKIRIEQAIPPSGGPYLASAPGAQEHLLNEFAGQIYEILKKMNLHKERLGIDAGTPPIINALEKKGLTVTLEGGKALLEARTVKTPQEQEIIRLLAAIIDGCFGVMARTCRPGVSEAEVWAECSAYAIKSGVNPAGGYICSGPRTWPKDISSEFTDRKLRPGDTVYADFFNWSLYGYRACYYRTFSIGPAAPDVKEAYNRLMKWLRDGEKMIKPGATTKDVVEKWPDDIELWAKRPPYVKDARGDLSSFFNNMGHGIGLSLYDPPFFWRPTSIKWPQKLEAGMTIAVETQDGTPDSRCGARVEDMIIITDDGHDVISRWPADELMELPLY